MTSYCIRTGITDSTYTEPRTRRRKAAIGWRSIRALSPVSRRSATAVSMTSTPSMCAAALTLRIGRIPLDPAGTPSAGWEPASFRAVDLLPEGVLAPSPPGHADPPWLDKEVAMAVPVLVVNDQEPFRLVLARHRCRTSAIRSGRAPPGC